MTRARSCAARALGTSTIGAGIILDGSEASTVPLRGPISDGGVRPALAAEGAELPFDDLLDLANGPTQTREVARPVRLVLVGARAVHGGPVEQLDVERQGVEGAVERVSDAADG